MLGAIDPAARPYIARVTADYLQRGRARDWFFRRVGALLTESSAATIAELQAAFRIAHSLVARGPGFPLPQYVHLTSLHIVAPQAWLDIDPTLAVARIEMRHVEPAADYGEDCPCAVTPDTIRLLEQSLLPSQVLPAGSFPEEIDKRGPSIHVVFHLNDTSTVNRLIDLFGR